MTEWQLAGICVALSQLGIGLLLIPGLRPLSQQQWLYAAVLASVAAYLLDPLVDGTAADFLLGALTGFLPGLFFLFSVSLFDDSVEVGRWHVLAAALTALPPLLQRCLQLAGLSGARFPLVELPQLLEFVLLAYALYIAIRYWQPDLVAGRRRLRLWFSGFIAFYLLLLILLREVVLPGDATLAALQFIPTAVTLLVTNALLLRYQPSLWPDGRSAPAVDAAPTRPERAPSVAQIPTIDDRMLDALQTLMDREHVYREMGLTLAELARRADVPVYRLREAINAGLGYRNFNDFLNSYRIREAAGRLRDPGDAQTQILVIALDAGFRSLSSFNKAFRAAFDCTPTEYRRRTGPP